MTLDKALSSYGFSRGRPITSPDGAKSGTEYRRGDDRIVVSANGDTADVYSNILRFERSASQVAEKDVLGVALDFFERAVADKAALWKMTRVQA